MNLGPGLNKKGVKERNTSVYGCLWSTQRDQLCGAPVAMMSLTHMRPSAVIQISLCFSKLFSIGHLATA